MAERRRAKRIATQFRIWCEGDDFTFLARSANASRGGLFLWASQPPAPGARFKIAVEELDAVAEVEVCWSRRSGRNSRAGAGVKIVSFEQGEQRWERYLEQNASRSGEHFLPWPVDPEDGDS